MIFKTLVCGIKKEIKASTSKKALKKAYPNFNFVESTYPSGFYKTGSYDGTIKEPFLVQVKKSNGIWDWFVNSEHPNAKYWIRL